MGYTAADIVSTRLIVGMEIHVELATRSKMFSRAGNPAHASFDGAEPNTLIDPTVLGLPGALPVMNKSAVEMSMMVGLALGGTISAKSKWDRKNYFYPDMPKAYQISQYDLPLCVGGRFEVPATDAKGQVDLDAPASVVRITRAHLEEDAGKLLHEAPGGFAIDHSIVDLNRAGTPLLEIVTEPDFTSAEQCVTFAKMLRNLCRFLGVTEGVMQKGHMRFEPNVNVEISLRDGTKVRTPVVEVKNLNSFRSVKGAVEYEATEQPRRWLADGRVMGRGMKQTRGWDDGKLQTFVQREKEDAHDYRYFPDPDLVPVEVSEAWREEVRKRIPELPAARFARYVSEYGLGKKEAATLVDEREVCLFYEQAIGAMTERGVERSRAGKVAANLILQSGAKRANERGVEVSELGISAKNVGVLGAMREAGELNNQSVDELFGLLCEEGNRQADAGELAKARGLVVVRDDAQTDAWIEQVFTSNPKVVDDVRGGKLAAAGRLVGEVMKLAGGKADAKSVREAMLRKLGVG